MSRPLITGDTPAIRELLNVDEQAILVPLADPQAIAAAVLGLRDRQDACRADKLHLAIRQRISPKAIGLEFRAILIQLLC